jgi:uncharacterized protein YlxW (UPF0749 family)
MIGVGILLGFISAKQFIIAPEVKRLTEEQPAEVMAVETAELYRTNEKIRTEIEQLTQQKNQLSAGASTGESENALQAAISQLEIITGLKPVTGPGIALGFPERLELTDLVDLVNALRNIGVEAISFGAVRVVDQTGFNQFEIKTKGIVDNLSLPLTIKAIGPPEVLVEALTRKGGILQQIGAPYTIEKHSSLDLPAIQKDNL